MVTGNSSRELFNYYLDHPRDYFKVSGTHYYRNLPKSDVRIILFLLLCLFSFLLHTLQYQRWEFAVKTLTKLSITNAGVKSGGTKESQEIFRRASLLYDSKIAALGSSSSSKAALEELTAAAIAKAKDNKLSALHVLDDDDKPIGKTKMQKDPIFLGIIDEVEEFSLLFLYPFFEG